MAHFGAAEPTPSTRTGTEAFMDVGGHLMACTSSAVIVPSVRRRKTK